MYKLDQTSTEERFYKLNPVKSESNKNKKIYLTPPILNNRLDDDLELCKKIIQKYDVLRKIDVSNNNFRKM